MERLIISLLLTGNVCLMTGCYYDVEEELYPMMQCDTMNVSYSEDILPVISGNCYTCHSQSANLGGITLEGYENIVQVINSGRLTGAINHEAGFSPMPENAPQLPDCDIKKIETWIANGVPEN